MAQTKEAITTEAKANSKDLKSPYPDMQTYLLAGILEQLQKLNEK